MHMKSILKKGVRNAHEKTPVSQKEINERAVKFSEVPEALRKAIGLLWPGAKPVADFVKRRMPAYPRHFALETLEPRLLLSSDPAVEVVAGVLTANLSDGPDTLSATHVGNAADGGIIVDLNINGAVTRYGTEDTGVTAITVDAGAGDDTFQFLGVTSPVSITGGIGNDRLIGPDGDQTWQITAANSGSVSNISFSGVESLQGAAGNQDTFVLGPNGSLEGGVDGGAGGFDTLEIEGDSHASVAYTATGPDSGSVVVDGNPIEYAGLEPIVLSGTVADAILTLNGDPNATLLSFNIDTGQLLLATTNGTIESILFGVPTTSLTINLGFGADTLAIGDLTGKGAFALTVNDPDDVTISGDVILDGSFTVNAGSDLVVADDLTIDVDGALTLTADAGFALTWTAVTPIFQDLDAAATIDIGEDVTLKGASVTVTAKSNNNRQADFEIDEIALQGFSPAQLSNIFVPALPPGVSITFTDGGDSNPDTITRSDTTTWVTDGFAVGQYVEVLGTTLNDGIYQVASLTG